ncbi:MAG: LolA family protein [Flavobacteriaceae bacterium]|tara:strand:+ start:856 stop:1512 length:657 start_codon:yes stop_codon:yes gene_type:complete
MNLICKIKSTLTLFFAFGILQGQTHDPEAKALLQAVSAKVENYNNIQIDFKYDLENDSENIRQETRGKITLSGNKYILDILGVQRLFDGETLYTISPDDEEVTISKDISKDDNTISPSALLTFYESGYNYKLDISQLKFGRKIQYIKLTPIDSEAEIKYALLGVDTKTKHIYNLIEIGENDTKTTLTILAYKTNIPLPKSFFKFKASDYDDYYINNLD